MNSIIFIPEQLMVGFQNRKDTFTGKLAYVIYYDEKGKLRKEHSWQNWRDRNIDPQELVNEPTTGFVLNKKVGGYCYHYDPRQTYVRVYDPRGFEFEITVPNLLWILENSDCIKGKGLAGEFVYGWDGAELLLVPVDSPEYKESQKISIAKFSKTFIKGKDLIVGHTYKFTNGEQYVYLGKYDFYDSVRDHDSGRFGRINAKIGKRFFFGYEGSGPHNTVVPQISIPKSLTRLVTEETSDIMSDQYADYVSLMKKNPHFSPEDISKDKFVPFAVNEIMGLLFKECPWNPPYRYPLHNLLMMFVRRNDGTITHVCLRYITKADTSTQFPEWKNPDAPIYYVTNGDYDYTPALNIDDFVAGTFETLYTNPVYTWQTKKVYGYKERPVTLTELLNHFTPVWHYTYLTNGEFYKKEFFNDNYDFNE